MLESCWCVGTYRVDLEIPRLAGYVQVNYNLLILQAKLLESNMGTVSPWAKVIGVENDLWGGHIANL